MIPTERAHLHLAAVSHPGMSGKNNEDTYAISAHQVSKRDPTPSVLAVLADGIGGHNAGEVAAEIATQTIRDIVSESDGARPLQILENAVVQAGQEVARQASSNHQQLGMGSTCACAWVLGNRLYTASVGDSRIYLLEKDSIQQITIDHTWVQEAIEHGVIEPEQARDHPHAHVIRRYLGSQRPVEPDFRLRLKSEESNQKAIANQGMKLKPGACVLLCSDGLTDLVEENEIFEIVQNHPNQQAVNALVDLANDRGGYDNITIVTLEMPGESLETIKLDTGTRKRFKGKLRWFTIFFISILVILLATYGILFYRDRTPLLIGTPTPTGTVEGLDLTHLVPQLTETLATTLTPYPLPSETPIQDTYTPWPTHTYPP